MKDNTSLENIVHEMKNIEDNNWNNIDHVNSIQMLLTSNNNGTTKDEIISQKVKDLRDKLQETINATSELISSLDNNDYNLY